MYLVLVVVSQPMVLLQFSPMYLGVARKTERGRTVSIPCLPSGRGDHCCWHLHSFLGQGCFRARQDLPPSPTNCRDRTPTPRNSSIATGRWCGTAAPKESETWYKQAKDAPVAHTPCLRRTPSKCSRLDGLWGGRGWAARWWRWSDPITLSRRFRLCDESNDRRKRVFVCSELTRPI